MFQKIKQTLKKTIITFYLISQITLAACGPDKEYYKTISPDSIPEANPITFNFPEKNLSFDEMTWQEAILYIQTPTEARHYNEYIRKNNPKSDGTIISSFKLIHQGAPVACPEGTFAAAATLNDNGYPPIAVIIGEKKDHDSVIGHILYIYKLNGEFGTLGIYNSDNNILPPLYKTLDDLVAYHTNIRNLNATGYDIINIKENYPNYIDADKKLPLKHMRLENKIK